MNRNIAEPFIIQRSMKPARDKMTEMHLPAIFKFVDDFANDTPAAICGYRRVEVDRAMRTVRAGKDAADRAFEGL